MQTVAESLYWLGHPSTIFLGVMGLNIIVAWHWKQDVYKTTLATGWFFLFFFITGFFFDPVVNKLNYINAHLFNGIWRSGDEAFYNMLLHWRTVLLPAYGPWLAIWLAGLLSMPRLAEAMKRYRHTPTSITPKTDRDWF